MRKETALKLLAGEGGSVADAARAVGTTRQAIYLWPDPLPRRIEDRVLAAQARRYLPPHLLGEEKPTPAARKARRAAPAIATQRA